MAVEFRGHLPVLRSGDDAAESFASAKRVEQLCLGLIAKPVFSGARHISGIKIVIGEVRMAGLNLSHQGPVAIQGRVEAQASNIRSVWGVGVRSSRTFSGPHLGDNPL